MPWRNAVPHAHVSRRSFLTGVGASAVAATAATVGLAERADASSGTFGGPAPLPIPFVAGPTGAPAPFDFIHWTLPGPAGALTQVNELEAFGLDVHRSTLWNYEGFTTYAVIAGTAHSSEGDMDVELDVRVMQGRYLDADGKMHHGTFGFF